MAWDGGDASNMRLPVLNFPGVEQEAVTVGGGPFNAPATP
jgi:hypothetical protein